MSRIKLIVGLGNPGSEYEHTRHNIGFDFIDELAYTLKTNFKPEKKFYGLLAKTILPEGVLWLLKPSTYMNKSGTSVQALANFYKIKPDEILVVHDELDIPCGQVRFKKGGSNGGHNGLKDIQSCLGSADFYRLRIGIDHPGDRNLVINYVLNKPTTQQKNLITQAVDKSLAVMPELFTSQFNVVQQKLHSK